MLREQLIIVCTCEIAGRVRGKGFPASELPSRLVSGVGWVPTNTMISALRPDRRHAFGATGDLILVPDADDGGACRFRRWQRARALSPRRYPPRPTARRGNAARANFLRRGLAALKEAAGLELSRQLRAGVRLYRRRGHAGRALQPRCLAAAGHLRRSLLVAAIRKAGRRPRFLPARIWQAAIRGDGRAGLGMKSGRRRCEAARDGARYAHSGSAIARSSRRSSSRTAPATASTSISASRISRAGRRCTIRRAPYRPVAGRRRVSWRAC